MKKIDDAMLRKRIRTLKALVLDVDGVLTDGGMFYGPSGEAMKKFNTRDGMGLAVLRDLGLRIALITGENSDIVRRRAEKLRIEDVYVGIQDKGAALADFLGRHGLTGGEAFYVGDDLNDLPAMKLVSVAFAVADAAPEVRAAAHRITRRKGGEGAVREVADLIRRFRK